MIYAFIYLTETDGDIKIEYLDSEEIKEKTSSLHPSDYAILLGDTIKSFEDEKFDIDTLK